MWFRWFRKYINTTRCLREPLSALFLFSRFIPTNTNNNSPKIFYKSSSSGEVFGSFSSKFITMGYRHFRIFIIKLTIIESLFAGIKHCTPIPDCVRHSRSSISIFMNKNEINKRKTIVKISTNKFLNHFIVL